MVNTDRLLFIEPGRATSREPVIDDLTRKMTAVFRLAEAGPGFLGCHICACGATSTNRNYTLPNGEVTNSLCVHYLAFHRWNVPNEELAKVVKFNYGLVDPTEEELAASHSSVNSF